MVEARGVINDCNKSKMIIQNLGGILKNEYNFSDSIYFNKGNNIAPISEILRIRKYSKTNWLTKNIILTIKKIDPKNHGKISKVILYQEFDKENEAIKYVNKCHENNFKFAFEFERIGWQYKLNGDNIFVEEINGYKPTVEVQSNSINKLNDLFLKLNVIEIFKKSLPEILKDHF